ncbi:MAG: SNF2-related protein [Blastocatellales bacterium]
MTAASTMVPGATDFRFASDDDLSGLGGPASRFQHNLAAIRLLKQLEADAREPSSLAFDEQQALARYTGWGDTDVLHRAFPNGAYSHARPCAELTGVLTEEEIRALLGSTLNAHYTALPVIRAIYAALEQSGIGKSSRLRVLEPAAGIGHFFGAMPEALVQTAERAAVELDDLTARILRWLYPQAKVFSQSFESTVLPQNYFDLILSNVPFGNYAVHDPHLKQAFLKASIHDYFFARSLSLARPGGVIAFITSRYTLDKAGSRVRHYLAERAELLAAVRLPENTFRRNAGTEVVTDVVILRKRAAVVSPDEMEARWMQQSEIEIKNANGEITVEKINRHFAENPQYMLGTPDLQHGMYRGNEFTLRGDGRDVAVALRETLIAQLPADLCADIANTSPSLFTEKEQGFAELNESSVVSDKAAAVDLAILPESSRQRASLLLDIYTAAKQIIRLQLLDAEDDTIKAAQRELNQLYERFLFRYGPINARQNLKDFNAHSPLVPFLRALEEPINKNQYRRAALFHSRTIRPLASASAVSSPKDALLHCLNQSGCVDLSRIAALVGQSEAEVARSLDGLIFQMPSGAYQTAEEYLSGDVVRKLREAEAAAALNTQFQTNVDALRAVQPTPLVPEEISARLGSGWIPTEVVTQFIKELIPQFSGQARYLASLAVWKIEDANFWARTAIEATETWGTSRMNALDLMDDALNLRTPTVYDEVTVGSNTTRVVNEAETIAAQAKLVEIKEKFTGWVWQEEARATQLATIYNERFNCLRARRYDGSHLQLPGMNSSVHLRSHQKDGIWRILQSKATLLGHCVGAGKTFLMIAAAMELKRLGLSHKSLAVVPNHLPAQWEQEARFLYPNIRLLVPTKADLSQAQRGELLSRIATGDYDLIVIPHSAFKLLPVNPAVVSRYIEREIAMLEAYLEDIPATERRANKKTVKEIQKAIKKLEVKLKETDCAIRRDSSHTITWEELGIDALFVDEAHLFKNLYIPTKMTRVAGMPNSDSQRAFDAFIKVRSLLENGGRVIFATATPVSNTLAEVYVMMKFLQLDLLEEMGLAHFDAWVQMFAETTQSLEMKPDGSGFRMNTRFNKFTNLPELAALWRQALDVKTPDQLNLPRPKVMGGGPQVISVPASEELKGFVKGLAERVEQIKSRRVAPEVDNMLKITSEGRKAALDIRLVLPSTSAPAQSKLNAVVEQIVKLYHASQPTRGTQVVFCDLATPKGR